MNEEDLKLEPPDPDAELQRKMIREVPLSHVSDPPTVEPPPRYQFSILQMLFVTLVVAFTTAFCQWFSPNLIAGVFGLLTLLALLAIIVIGKGRPGVQMAWLVLGLIYVIIAVVAAFQA